MAIEIVLQIRLGERCRTRVLREPQAHFLDQQATDDDIVVEAERTGLLDQLRLMARRTIAHDAHLLDQAPAHTAILEVQGQDAGLAVKQLLFDRLLNQRGQLLGRRLSAPTLGKIGLHHADALGRNHNRRAINGAVIRNRRRPQGAYPEERGADEHEVKDGAAQQPAPRCRPHPGTTEHPNNLPAASTRPALTTE